MYVHDSSDSSKIFAIMYATQSLLTTDGERALQDSYICVDLQTMKTVVVLDDDVRTNYELENEPQAVNVWKFLRYQVIEKEEYDRRFRWTFQYNGSKRRIKQIIKVDQEGFVASTDEGIRHFKFRRISGSLSYP